MKEFNHQSDKLADSQTQLSQSHSKEDSIYLQSGRMSFKCNF